LLHKDDVHPQKGGGGATYQRGIGIILKTQIRQNVEVYIDDVVVKSKKCGCLVNNLKEVWGLLDDLKEVFDNLLDDLKEVQNEA
jgi:hypothetical protein